MLARIGVGQQQCHAAASTTEARLCSCIRAAACRAANEHPVAQRPALVCTFALDCRQGWGEGSRERAWASSYKVHLPNCNLASIPHAPLAAQPRARTVAPPQAAGSGIVSLHGKALHMLMAIRNERSRMDWAVSIPSGLQYHMRNQYQCCRQ